MKSVSVVIPCFNAGKFLDDAVRSALAQTWSDLEVVVVDDGSDDAETLHLLERAHWPRTRIFHQQNAGPSSARNHAIREARGVYILPLDADDTIEPTYVEKAVAVLDGRPDVGCVYCRAMKFGAEQGPWQLPPYTLDELVIDNVIFVTALLRKADWQSIGGFNERLRHGVEDYDFWLRMVASGKEVVQLDEFLFNYRVQEASRTTRFQETLDGKVAMYAEIFRNNKEFYAAHAETLYKHRFGLDAQIAGWMRRYEDLQRSADTRNKVLESRCHDLETRLAGMQVYWQGRYGGLDAWMTRHSSLRKVLGAAREMFRPHRGRQTKNTLEKRD